MAPHLCLHLALRKLGYSVGKIPGKLLDKCVITHYNELKRNYKPISMIMKGL